MSHKQRDETLAEHAFRRHYGAIHRFLSQRTRDDDRAQDIAQEVFTNAVRDLHGNADGQATTLAWLYRVAERRLIDDDRRRRARPRLVSLNEASQAASGDGYERARAREVIRVAIDGLPREQRQVVELKLLEGRRFAEIADHLGVSEAACKMRLKRALLVLRDELAREGIEP